MFVNKGSLWEMSSSVKFEIWSQEYYPMERGMICTNKRKKYSSLQSTGSCIIQSGRGHFSTLVPISSWLHLSRQTRI